MSVGDTIVAPITSIYSDQRFALRISGREVSSLRESWLGGVDKLAYASIKESIDLGFTMPISILSLTMPEGCSYTREDIWEIHFEANETVLAKLLKKIYKAGIRPALPGEFTRRSFLNGRIDLDQAQAIAVLVSAKGKEHREQALRMMAGHRGDMLRSLRQQLLNMRSHLEAVIDFPEEPDAFESRAMWRREWTELKKQIVTCQQQMKAQMNMDSNFKVLVIGAANAGKSSFLKCMIPSSQPIISSEAGTTLDLVPYNTEIEGQALLLYDTPGLKHSEGLLDELSLNQLREKISGFDAYVLIEQDEDDFAEELSIPLERPILKLLAKSDLDLENKSRLRWSALTREGEGEVKAALLKWATEYKKEEQSPWWSLRCQILEKGEESIEKLRELLCEVGAQEELAAYEIDEWLDMWDGVLAEEKDSEALLDRVFGEFCIGK